MSALLGLLATAWGFLRQLTWREILAGAVTLGMAFLYILGRRQGASKARREQAEADMELSEQIRDRADEAKQKAARDVGALDHDELVERMRARGRLRD